ncbi:MAG: hypothetical protein ACX930_08490 [Erythrobacter sp.]
MSGWAIVAVVAIVVWGIVQMAKARHGITTDAEGNESYALRDETASRAEAEETRREIEQLRERLHVLERIATDSNTMDARERARIAAEIESLRGPDEPSVTEPSPTATNKEQSQ